jgi:hypothetical protein
MILKNITSKYLIKLASREALAGRFNIPERQHIKKIKQMRAEIAQLEKSRVDFHKRFNVIFSEIKRKYEGPWVGEKQAEFDKQRDKLEKELFPPGLDSTTALSREQELKRELKVLERELRMSGVRQKEILTSLDQLGGNISSGGNNNLGVYEINGFPNYVARKSKWGKGEVMNEMLRFQAALKKHPRIKKVVQVKEFEENGKLVIYQVLERAKGKPLDKFTEDYLSKIPEDQKINFWKDLETLKRLGLKVDTEHLDNYFYDSSVGVQFIDTSNSENAGESSKEQLEKRFFFFKV